MKLNNQEEVPKQLQGSDKELQLEAKLVRKATMSTGERDHVHTSRAFNKESV